MSMTLAPDSEALPTFWALFVLVVLVLTAAASDVRSHKIPNRLIGLGLVMAAVAGCIQDGGTGLLVAGAGFVVGLAVWLPMYLLRTLGAGDVKLMAMVGAFLGPMAVLSATLLTFLAGGVLALAYAVSKGSLGRLLSNVRGMLYGAVAEMVLTHTTTVLAPATSIGRLPYAVAIAAGTLGQIVLQLTGRSLL